MRPAVVFALLGAGLLIGGTVGYVMQPAPPVPETVYVEVPGPAVGSGSCEDGFVLAVDFIHESLIEISEMGLAVYNVNDETLTPLADWFPSYESMKDVVDAAASQECGK